MICALHAAAGRPSRHGPPLASELHLSRNLSWGGRPMSGRKLAFLAPISWIAVGVAILAMPFVFEAKDEFGLLFGLTFGATCLGIGAFQLWRLKRMIRGPRLIR